MSYSKLGDVTTSRLLNARLDSIGFACACVVYVFVLAGVLP